MLFLRSSLLVIMLIVGGCTARGWDGSGLPSDSYIVGGGFSIDYTAPVAGTAIWANKTGEQLLMTKSLEAGEEFSIHGDPSDATAHELFGDDISKARLVLYFIPAADAQLQK